MKRETLFVVLSLACLTTGISACGRSNSPSAAVSAADAETATPKAKCGKGSRPEPGLQGRLSQADIDSGLATKGITCNTEMVGSFVPETHLASVGGWKVARYVDANGHECAYYDASNIFPLGILDGAVGVNVMDMSDPTHPALATRLLTPAMLSPHESLVLNEKRGLLVAVLGNPAFGPGVVDIYDVSQDCRNPVFKSSSLAGTFGHESGISPDGNTFYSASPFTPTLTAVNIKDPSFPVPVALDPIASHGVSISADGNRAYIADTSGLIKILDVSEIQARDPSPKFKEISTITWPTVSIPQVAIPITIKGKPYLVEVDEFGALSTVGAARIIDIADEKNPRVISNLRLEVHQPENFDTIKDDPGASSTGYASYAAHFCNVPTRVDPTIVACSMIMSGLRVFDIRDPYHPREVAYFNAPVQNAVLATGPPSNGAFSSPAFVPERKEIWYTDSSSGFYVVRVTNGAWH